MSYIIKYRLFGGGEGPKKASKKVNYANGVDK